MKRSPGEQRSGLNRTARRDRLTHTCIYVYTHTKGTTHSIYIFFKRKYRGRGDNNKKKNKNGEKEDELIITRLKKKKKKEEEERR